MRRFVALCLVLIAALAGTPRAVDVAPSQFGQLQRACTCEDCCCGAKCACNASAPKSPSERTDRSAAVPATPKFRVVVAAAVPAFANVVPTPQFFGAIIGLDVQPAHPDARTIRIRSGVFLT